MLPTRTSARNGCKRMARIASALDTLCSLQLRKSKYRGCPYARGNGAKQRCNMRQDLPKTSQAILRSHFLSDTDYVSSSCQGSDMAPKSYIDLRLAIKAMSDEALPTFFLSSDSMMQFLLLRPPIASRCCFSQTKPPETRLGRHHNCPDIGLDAFSHLASSP